MKLSKQQELIIEDIAKVMYNAYIESIGDLLPIWSVFENDRANSKEVTAWLDSALAVYKYILE